MMVVGGCSTSVDKPTPLLRTLPDSPAYLVPVALPDPSIGKSAYVIAAENRAALVEANARIACGRRWYGCVQAQMAKGAGWVSRCGRTTKAKAGAPLCAL